MLKIKPFVKNLKHTFFIVFHKNNILLKILYFIIPAKIDEMVSLTFSFEMLNLKYYK